MNDTTKTNCMKEEIKNIIYFSEFSHLLAGSSLYPQIILTTDIWKYRALYFCFLFVNKLHFTSNTNEN